MPVSNTGAHAVLGDVSSVDLDPFDLEDEASVSAILIAVPDRPANATRSSFHVISALFCLSLVFFLTTKQLPWVAVAFAGWAWSMETLRRISPRANTAMMKFFAPIAHRHERDRINSATWYMTAIVVLTLTYSPVIQVVGVAVLGFGDPVAGIVGRRFGRHKLIHGRTLEGSIAFVVAASAASFTVLQLLPSSPAIGISILVSICAAVAGAVAELLSRRMDDNFSIPLSAAATAAVVMLAARISLWG